MAQRPRAPHALQERSPAPRGRAQQGGACPLPGRQDGNHRSPARAAERDRHANAGGAARDGHRTRVGAAQFPDPGECRAPGSASMKRGAIALALGIAGLTAGAGYGLYWFGMSRGMQMAEAPASGKKALYWYDPMVPGQRFEKPGKSPCMDMKL